jgi:hypothetical protein
MSKAVPYSILYMPIFCLKIFEQQNTILDHF